MRLVVLSLLGFLLPHFSSGARPAFRVRDASYPQSERTDNGDAVSFGRRTANTRPLIGVITQPGDPAPDNHSYVSASYIKLIEAGGGRAVPILFDDSMRSIEYKFSKINGLLIPGGGAVLQKGHMFYDTAAKLLSLARDANRKGDYFPVLGICLGFETILAEANGSDDILTDFEAEDAPAPLFLTKDAAVSKLMAGLPANVVRSLQQRPIAMENHGKGVSPKDFENKVGKDFYNVATSEDKAGVTYVAATEHKRYPIYGVQFHPEKNAFESTPTLHIPHDSESVLVSQAFASFIVDEARKNTHAASGWEEESRLWSANFPRIFTGKSAHDGGLESDFEEIIVFPYSD